MSLVIKAHDFFAVKDAEIILDGITVISGVNGCGKSTLAKSAYELLFAAINYDSLVSNVIQRSLFEMRQSLRSALTHVSGFIKRIDAVELQRLYRPFVMPIVNDEKYLEFLDSLIQTVSQVPQPLPPSKKKYYESFCRIICESFDRKINENGNAAELLVEFKTKYLDRIDSAEILKSERKTRAFQRQWQELFGQKLDPNLYNVYENEIPIVDAARDVVLLPNSAKNVFYIDTPMSLLDAESCILDDSKKHWRDLNEAIWKTKKFGKPFDFKPKDAGYLLNGSFEWNDEASSLLYQSSDNGPVFDILKHGATGLKSFVIMQSLYRKGLINKNTLLILDEPEAHLHPQWIVHFAKLLVMLRKETQCTFLISSHSTDMVSALKFIAEKELKQKTRFYLAESSNDNPPLYDYTNLDDDIERIFEKFNKSFRLMDSYSEEEIMDLAES